MKSKVVVRFAPSPTGTLHLGGARTALFNYLFAAQNGGHFILRIEDTDRERSQPEFEANIIEALRWLAIPYDQFHRQSERGLYYAEIISHLLKSDQAYWSREEKPVIRFRNPGTTVTFNDLIRGEVSFATGELGDFVIAKSETEPLYHLAVVADDLIMNITHVIRGEDHISNTPRQILLLEALGGARPAYAHIPLILAPDRSKLSKRHGALPVTDYRAAGFLPLALVNYLALLGWHPQDEKEIFNLRELVQVFDLARVQKGGAVFSQEKLLWFNREYLRCLPDADFISAVSVRCPQLQSPEKLLPILRDRLNTWQDLDQMLTDGELDYFAKQPEYSAKLLKTPEHLPEVLARLEKIGSTEFTKEKVKEVIWPLAEEQGRGAVLWPLRLALSGREKSPDPFSLAAILGREETLKRLRYAIQLS